MRAGERRDTGIAIIVAYKAVKAFGELALAVALVVVASRGGLEALRALASRLEAGVAGHWSVLAGHALARLVSDRGAHVLEAGLAIDAIVSAFEGWTLWRGLWWGPWLVVGATGSPLPVELFELARRPTLPRALVTAVNVAVVWYLARRIVRRRSERRPVAAGC